MGGAMKAAARLGVARAFRSSVLPAPSFLRPLLTRLPLLSFPSAMGAPPLPWASPRRTLVPPLAAAAVEPGEAAAASPLESSGPMTWPSRTAFCGRLGEVNVGQNATLCGWVDGYRNFGGVLFLDIRDHTGLLQVPPTPYIHLPHQVPVPI